MANLIPPKRGEIRNPSGKNQYSYKRDFERAIDSLLAGEITPEHLEFLPESIRPLIQDRADITRGEVIALVTVVGALGGDEKHLPEVLKRLWPVTEKREHSTPDGPLRVASTPAIDMSLYDDDEREQLQSLIHRQLQSQAGDES